MLKDPRSWTAAVAFVIAAVLIGRFTISARPPAVMPESVQEIRYVCRETGEVFALPFEASARVNPKTGRSTLVPAVYDAKRKRWKPGPPPEIMHRKGLIRPAS
ncbi:MAG: hypothetical protein ACKOWG_09120 [Planctomycetia bacterium]